MLTFEGATLIGVSKIKLISAVTSDGRTLSLITEGAECRDRNDATSRFSALPIDITINIVGTDTDKLELDVRGATALRGIDAFAVLKISTGSERQVLTGDGVTGQIVGKFSQVVTGPIKLQISMLLLCNAGANVDSECLIAVDTLDLSFSG